MELQQESRDQLSHAIALLAAWHRGEKDNYTLAMQEIEDQINEGSGPRALLPLVVGLVFIGDGLLDHFENVTGVAATELLQSVALAVKRSGGRF